MSELSSSPTSDVKLTRVFSRTPSSWDPQDDLLLRHLKEQQKLGWKEIASHFAHRTPNACQFRWRRLRSGSLKTNTNSPTPTSGANTPNTQSNSITGNNESSPSNSASPPPSSSGTSINTPLINSKQISEPLVSKFSSLPTNKTTSSPKLKDKKTQPINVPVYNQWTFHTSTLSNNDKQPQNNISFKDSPDPLSSSLNSLDSDDEKNSAVMDSNTIQDWTNDEDELLITRRSRALSFAELSILLPSRTESEIHNRIDELDKKTKTKRSNSTRSHQHPHPIHTPSHQNQQQQQQQPSSFTRSYSSSSQTSLASSSLTSTSQFFLSQDSTRSKSFSYITPYSQSTDRYNLRKNSITNSLLDSKSRSNSFLQQPPPQRPVVEESQRDNSSSDEGDTTEQGQIKIEPKLPPLGSIFNDLYSR